MNSTRIPYYLDYLPAALLNALAEVAVPVDGVPGLQVTPGLQARFPSIETTEALRFVCSLYEATREPLATVLEQRAVDRAFIDQKTLEFADKNQHIAFDSPDYATVLGCEDDSGRIVVGPRKQRSPAPNVTVPSYMQGEQVTLFGPPDTAKMSINAMNTLQRRLPDEPKIVAELVEASGQVPRWGADNEDSKTPMIDNLLSATENLIGCFDRSLQFEDPRTGKRYQLNKHDLSKPIKRIPGLALPDGNHLFEGAPLPLHLLDFALHLFHNRTRPEALVFYVPKLENEEEAAYLHTLINEAEHSQHVDPHYSWHCKTIYRLRESALHLSNPRKARA